MAFPDTRASLILEVKDPANRLAWEEFVQIYRPIIYRIARSRGMQEADAQDLAQQVLASVAGAIGRWKKNGDGARFRNWLSRVVRNAIVKALSRAPRDMAVGGSTMIDQLGECPQPEPAAEELIDTEYRRQLYLRAAAIVQFDVTPDTWLAFEMTELDGVAIEEVASQLNKSVGCVYAARSRVMRRLREAVQELEEADR